MNTTITEIFSRLENSIVEKNDHLGISIIENTDSEENKKYAFMRKSLIGKMMLEVDHLANEIKKDDTILVSVKHQKLLKTCFQIITSFGITQCLIPGLGINLSKRCSLSTFMSTISMTDQEKYDLLVKCTDFFARSYDVPVLKNIIITYHLSDYLASLIQLSFAPLKKPGSYENFTMTQDIYDRLLHDRQKYVLIYKNLVNNCFQPTLMKELLILQSVTEPSPPAFVKRIIAKEMSLRLLASGGLLSLIRCFIESYNIDSGFEWKKIDMISKIISTKHGNITDEEYLTNICSQLTNIMAMNNTHYLGTALACIFKLNEKFQNSPAVFQLKMNYLQPFSSSRLMMEPQLPGTIIMTPQEVEHAINILDTCASMGINCDVEQLSKNAYILFQIGAKCSKNLDMKVKIKNILLRCLSPMNKTEMSSQMEQLLFGDLDDKQIFTIVESEVGISIKYSNGYEEYPKSEALVFFLEIFKASEENMFVGKVFETSLQLLINLTVTRKQRGNTDLLVIEEKPLIFDTIDQHYALTLQLLTEISTCPKVLSCLKADTTPLLNFIEHFLVKNYDEENSECATIALVLLNTILTSTNKSEEGKKIYSKLLPVLTKMSQDESTFNSILCKEAIEMISSGHSIKNHSKYEKAVADIFDELLPVRAHGIVELTKLIDSKDPETLSKKHYIFCLLQEQLKNTDSYIYLASINGIAALCTFCTEDVLHVLCKEYLQMTSENEGIDNKENQDAVAKMRMKIGDIIVKVTRKLGEMAVNHKTILLNTILCACRDDDPLIRTSALSNLAEVALVLNYKIGSIVYEVLLCIWSTIETDKAVECRRAAVMVISSFLKGLGQETLVQLKENLLPLYRTLKKIYHDPGEDSIMKLHAQLALEELNDIVHRFLFPELKLEKQIHVLNPPEDIFK